jgi:hypothetical protein
MMKATIQLTEGELKAAVCNWLITEYGISVNATNDIKITDYCEEYLGDPQCAPASPATRYGAEVKVQSIMLKKGK